MPRTEGILLFAMLIAAAGCRRVDDTPPKIDRAAVRADYSAKSSRSSCRLRVRAHRRRPRWRIRHLPEPRRTFAGGVFVGYFSWDQSGCTLSARLAVPVHQLRLLQHAAPRLPWRVAAVSRRVRGASEIHPDGRPFDTIAARRNEQRHRQADHHEDGCRGSGVAVSPRHP